MGAPREYIEPARKVTSRTRDTGLERVSGSAQASKTSAIRAPSSAGERTVATFASANA